MYLRGAEGPNKRTLATEVIKARTPVSATFYSVVGSVRPAVEAHKLSRLSLQYSTHLEAESVRTMAKREKKTYQGA